MRWSALVSMTLAAGCSPEVDVLGTLGSFDGSVAPRDSGTLDAGGSPSGFCGGRGPDLEGGACAQADAWAESGQSLCTCGDLVSNQRIEVVDPTGEAGVSVGFNGRVQSNGTLRVQGSLIGASGLSGAARADLDGTLVLAGDLETTGPFSVAKDAFVGGRVAAPALVVGGALVTPDPVPTYDTADSVRTEAVTVSAPCPCADPLNVSAQVQAAVDDGVVDPDLLRNGRSLAVSLPCGRHRLSEISGPGPIELTILGRTTLRVDADVSITEDLTLVLQPGAELDLFVAGSWVVGGQVELGTEGAPSRLRIYVGTEGTMELAGGGRISGHLYAPRAELVSSGSLAVEGSFLVERASASGPLTLNADLLPAPVCP